MPIRGQSNQNISTNEDKILKPLIKVMLILLAVFSALFLLGRVFGILTIDNIRLWLEWASHIDLIFLALVIIALLAVDMFITIPTLSLTLLAGYFLGFPLGALTALLGTSMAVGLGYGLSRKWGEQFIATIIKDQTQLIDLKETFHTHGHIMISLARAAPMVPEVCACMAGATKMAFGRYSLFHLVGTVPYVLIAAYAGSISSVDDPMPAIYAVILLYSVGWIGWWGFQRHSKRKLA
jgi:uncharacterized membrane protein YdjX (TVP38/TMEM64 family)